MDLLTDLFAHHGLVAVVLAVLLEQLGAPLPSTPVLLLAGVESAARTLRQSGWSSFLRVTLPLAWPGILAGTLLAFARAMGEFGASLMVAGSIPGQTQTASMAIYDAVQAGRDDLALALALVVSAVSVAVLVLSNRYLQRPPP